MSDFYDDVQAMLESSEPAVVSEGERILQERDAEAPDDALVQFLIASAYDGSGREATAMTHYERVDIDALPAVYQPQIYVQAGSTLRNLGRLADARLWLERGIARFPEYLALPAFLALVDVSAGDDRAAVNRLFGLLLRDTVHDESLRRYRRALTWYANEIADPAAK